MFGVLKEGGAVEFLLQFGLELSLAEVALAAGLAAGLSVNAAARDLGVLPSDVMVFLLLALVFLACALAAYAVHRRARAAEGSLLRGKGWALVLMAGAAPLAYIYHLSANLGGDQLGLGFAAFPFIGAAVYGLARLAFWLSGLRHRARRRPEPA